MREIGLAITVALYLHIDYKAAGAKIINYKLTSGEDNLPVVPAMPFLK